MSDNITPSFEEAFKHIKNKLPSSTLKTLEQNYNNNITLDNLQENDMQRKDFKASNFPNANAQIEQSKLANATNDIELEDFNLKTKNFIELKNKIDNYKSQGYDVSSYENRLKEIEKDLEISIPEKLGVFGRNLPLQYINGVKHFINSGPIELSHSQKMDKARWEREKVINPIKTMLMDEGLDPINHLGLAFSKGSRLARLGKDYLSGQTLGTSTDALKHGADDNYKLSDSLYAGAFGGVLNAGLGQVLGKSLKSGINSLDEIQAKVKNDVGLNEYKGDIGDGAIASKLSDDIDKLSPSSNVDNSNVLNSLTKAEKQEKRGIYNVTFNGKNSSEVKKYDLEALNDYIKYEKGFENTRTGKGAIHIQKHLENGSFGEISKEELLDLGNVIRNGQLSLEHGKNVYRLKKDDGTIFTAVTGSRNKDSQEQLITYYSNRNSGKDIDFLPTITSTFPNNGNLPNQNLKFNKSIKDMTTQEIVEAYKQNQQRALNVQNPNINKLQDINTQDFIAKSNIAKDELLNPKLSKNHIDEFINKTIGQDNISKEQRDLIHTLQQTGLVDKLNTQKLKSNIAGNYDVKAKTISLNENSNINPQQKAQALVHELIHSSSENLLRASAKFKAEVSLLYHEAKKSFSTQGLDTNVYGFTKPSEFIAEAFSNPNFAKELNSVKVSPIVKEKLGLKEYVNTLWEAIYSKFSQVVSKLSGKEFKLNKDSYYYALQNSLNKHRNDVDVIKDSILNNKALRDEVLNNADSLVNGSKVLDNAKPNTLNMSTQAKQRYIDPNTNKLIDVNLSKDAQVLPKPLSKEEFINQFGTNGWTNIKTPTGNVRVNIKSAWEHIDKGNTYSKDRIPISGAFKKILEDPLLIVDNKAKKQIEYYAPFKDPNNPSAPMHLISIAKDYQGNLNLKTFFKVDGGLNRVKNIINASDIDTKYFKYSSPDYQHRYRNDYHVDNLGIPKDDIILSSPRNDSVLSNLELGNSSTNSRNLPSKNLNINKTNPKEMSTQEIFDNLNSNKNSNKALKHEPSSDNVNFEKTPKEMNTEELIKNNLDVIKKQKDILNSQISKLNDKVAVQKVGNIFDRIINNVFDKSVEALSKVKIGNKTLGEIGTAIKESNFTNAFTGHKLYEKKSYMNPREDMLKQKNKQMEDILLLHEKLKFLSKDTRKAMYEYMNGNKNIILDPNVKSFSDKYIKYIDDISSELVDLKVIDQAQADKFYGRYLFRSYSKDLKKQFATFNNSNKTIDSVHSRGEEWIGKKDEYEHYLKTNQLGDFFDGMIDFQKLKNGKYKFRRDWSKAQRQSWGEIDDIAYILPNTLMRIQQMKSHAIFLKQISKSCDLVLDTKGLSDIPQGYTLLNGKKYGALNGYAVSKDVASDINEFSTALFGRDGNIFSKDVVQAYHIFSAIWKKQHTVWNSTAHFNNYMSNVVMQYMAGINPVTAVKHSLHGYQASVKIGQLRYLEAKNSIVGLSKEEQATFRVLKSDKDVSLWQKAQESGLFGRSKLNDILNQYTAPLNKNIDTSPKDGVFNKAVDLYKKADNKLSAIYQGEDDIMRFSMLKSLTKQGKDFDQALKIVNNTIPDYTKPMSQMAKFGRNSLLTPFVSWTYYSTPIILRQLKERPSRAIALFGALYGINKAFGIDPLDNKDIPQKNFSMKRIPIYKNGNEVTTIKVDRWIPHIDVLNPLDFIRNLTNYGAWSGITDVLNNKNSYFGNKITSRDGLAGTYDIAKYGVQQLTPDILDNIYNLGESAIFSKEKRQKNPVLLERTSTQELLKLLGVNTMTYDKKAQLEKALAQELKKSKKEKVTN